MRKISLILVLILSLTFTGFAQSQTAASKDNFKIKPKLYWSAISPFILRSSDHLIGLTVIGLDVSLLKYKNFRFLAVGGGLETHYKQVLGWHSYYDYWGYSQRYYGLGYKFLFEFYLKFTPIKYHWNWASKILKMDSYLEIGITHKGDPVVGLTFSGNPFKKKSRETEEDKR